MLYNCKNRCISIYKMEYNLYFARKVLPFTLSYGIKYWMVE